LEKALLLPDEARPVEAARENVDGDFTGFLRANGRGKRAYKSNQQCDRFTARDKSVAQFRPLPFFRPASQKRSPGKN
jgi:hypothetical protein